MTHQLIIIISRASLTILPYPPSKGENFEAIRNVVEQAEQASKSGRGGDKLILGAGCESYPGQTLTEAPPFATVEAVCIVLLEEERDQNNEQRVPLSASRKIGSI